MCRLLENFYLRTLLGDVFDPIHHESYSRLALES